MWSGSGDELFYRTPGSDGGLNQYWAVGITISGDTLTLSTPVPLFEFESVGLSPSRSYDVAPDGRFLMIHRDWAENLAAWRKYLGNKMSVVLNWSEELRRLAPSE